MNKIEEPINLEVDDDEETIRELIDLIYLKNYVGGIKDNNDRAFCVEHATKQFIITIEHCL